MSGEDSNIYLEQHQAVYIDIAKVASSSIKAALALELGLEAPDGNPHKIAFPHPERSPSNFNAPDAVLYPGLYTFAFVRNPWDRLVSCYRDKIAGEVPDFTSFADTGVAHCLSGFDAFTPGMSFREFTYAVTSIPDEQADEHFRSQARFVTNASGKQAVDYVGRYEQLSIDFASVAHRIGLPSTISLARLQAAPIKNYRDYYTADTQALVAQRYAEDIDLFHYRWKGDSP